MGAPSRGNDFEEAFRKVWPAAFAVAHRVLGDVGDAEDAAAEGLARALVAWPRVGGLAHCDGWMLRVVGNVALDRARRRTRAGRCAGGSVRLGRATPRC